MSEKRFEFYSDEDLVGVLDIVTGRTFNSFEIVDVLNEQQATIRKLQDLCGESDGENAKLRIENKRLEEENEQLKNQNIEYEEVQCRIMNYIIDKGLGSEFAKFLRENM